MFTVCTTRFIVNKLTTAPEPPNGNNKLKESNVKLEDCTPVFIAYRIHSVYLADKGLMYFFFRMFQNQIRILRKLSGNQKSLQTQ